MFTSWKVNLFWDFSSHISLTALLPLCLPESLTVASSRKTDMWIKIHLHLHVCVCSLSFHSHFVVLDGGNSSLHLLPPAIKLKNSLGVTVLTFSCSYSYRLSFYLSSLLFWVKFVCHIKKKTSLYKTLDSCGDTNWAPSYVLHLRVYITLLTNI